MSCDTTVRETRPLQVGVALGLSGGVCEFTIDLNDEKDVMQKLIEIVEAAKLPLIGQLNLLSKENESLKKRVLLTDEIQRLAGMLKILSNEIRYDGRSTTDDLLVGKLEGMLKS